MNIFGGGFTAPPGNSCKLRPAGTVPLQGQPQGSVPVHAPGMFQNQQTQPMRQLGVVPAAPTVTAPPAAPQGQSTQVNTPFGPKSVPVMKKGEAPCPICRG